MTTQPEALRLADELEMWTLGEPAAAELRRLHDQRDALLEALKKAVKLNSFREFNDHIPAMKAAIKAAEENT